MEEEKLVVVVGNKPASILRQINKKGVEIFGKNYGYEAKKVKTIDFETSIWILN